ncbi:F-box/kelch-repeat protein At1g80440-like [Lolium rigidum]|uniref:F-box/kelch-repeat protein At1g80440-like n=1 Tax=Lolium rigidum TaxID=89674 RepID=UPI001F5D75B5|nr:F-box/kelch-repeat protein At1g80440-like [Lolium rigidum]
MGELIPGLPEDVARECLLRVGFRQLPAAHHTSRLWKAEVESPLYSRLRRANGLSRPLIALSQALPPLATSGPACKYAASAALSNSYRLVLHDPADGGWATLPPLPGGGGLPLFCQLAAVACGGRRKLVVLGGWDPETWTPTDTVHVYDFLAGAWRPGAPMPGPRRSFFACAAAGGRVFVAGGHDDQKNALRSAAAYDAEADAWAALPDMALERDEARGVCVDGRFVVVGGYPTQAQGRFSGTGEAFDTAAWAWGPVQERVVDEGTCPRTCCVAPSAAGPMYMLRDGHLAARDSGNPWRSVARVPEDGGAATTVVAIGDGRVVVVGAGLHGGGEKFVYVLSEETGTNGAAPSWARAVAPPEFAGHVQAACCVEV